VNAKLVIGGAAPRPLQAVGDETVGQLSVAELQQALRAARRTTAPAAGGVLPPAMWAEHAPGGDVPRICVSGIEGRCVAVVAAHAGAGASTAALALADAAGESRNVQLVDCACPAVSGLVAVASAELGLDAAGGWRRGTRGSHVAIDRPATTDRDLAWPPPAVPASPDRRPLTVVDLGLLRGDGLLAALGARDDTAGVSAVVLVCRVTVPAARQAEQALADLSGIGWPVVVLAVGSQRWPGAVSTTSGPVLAGMRAAGQVVALPVDRRLECSGLTAAPLPKSVLAAGRTLLDHLDRAGPVPPATPTAGWPTGGRHDETPPPRPAGRDPQITATTGCVQEGDRL
jgi:hypothetical protein